MRKAYPWFLMKIEGNRRGASEGISSAFDEVGEKIHRTQMCIPLKPVFSRHKRDRVQITDEPTGNLDSRTSLEVMQLLKLTSSKFHQTIVMITHNPEIAQVADRMIRIEDGRIAEQVKEG